MPILISEMVARGFGWVLIASIIVYLTFVILGGLTKKINRVCSECYFNISQSLCLLSTFGI